jgi:predicted double-glycine peptidase
MNIRLLKQTTDYTCGPVCLMMLSGYRDEMGLARIASTNQKIGTTRKGMIRAARKLGYEVSTGTGATLDLIRRQRRPVIVLFKDTPDSFHYSIIMKVGQYVTIADPWEGKLREIEANDFVDSWVCQNGTKAWWMALSIPQSKIP